MHRVVFAASVALSTTACSLGSATISSGYTDTPDTSSLNARPVAKGAALGGEPGTSRGMQVAKLDDRAPKGSYETAPSGALADRDYSQTNLDAVAAQKAINAYRKSRGLKPLKLNAELTEAAKAHSRDLAKWDRISHYGSDGSNPWDRVKRTGYKARVAAENVGTGQVDFNEVLKGWQESPGHNKNLLLTDAESMGIALVQDPNTEFKSFWTLVVGATSG